ESRRGVANVSSEEQVHGRAEEVFVLQKERPLLGEINGISLVYGDLRVFRFDLAEVGMRGGIDGEMVADHEFRIHAGCALGCGLLKIGILGVARVESAETAQQSVRNELDIASRRNSFQTVQCGGLA